MRKPFAPAHRAEVRGMINMMFILTLQKHRILAVAFDHHGIVNTVEHWSIIRAISQPKGDAFCASPAAVLQQPAQGCSLAASRRHNVPEAPPLHDGQTPLFQLPAEPCKLRFAVAPDKAFRGLALAGKRGLLRRQTRLVSDLFLRDLTKAGKFESELLLQLL